MKLYSDMVSDRYIRSDEWERRASQGTAVGRCHCGALLSCRKADRPAYSTVTYRDVFCTAGHEATLTGSEYKGKVLQTGRTQVDISEARHEPALRVIEGGKT